MRWAMTALGLAAVLAGAGRAEAAYMQYTLSTTASGSLGGKEFSGASVTIDGYGDTSQIANPSPGVFNLPLFANSVLIEGFPTASFELTGLVVGLNQDAGAAGFLYGPSLDLILGVGSPGLSDFELDRPDGPFVGDTLFNLGTPLATTAGELILLAPADRSRFTASAGPGPAVPEPASLALAAAGAACLAAYGRLKTRGGRGPRLDVSAGNPSRRPPQNPAVPRLLWGSDTIDEAIDVASLDLAEARARR